MIQYIVILGLSIRFSKFSLVSEKSYPSKSELILRKILGMSKLLYPGDNGVLRQVQFLAIQDYSWNGIPSPHMKAALL